MLFFKKHIISDKILGCVAQASKDGNLLIILISFLKNSHYFLPFAIEKGLFSI